MNPLYLGLASGCVLLLLAICWLLFIRKGKSGETVVEELREKGFAIPPSINQQIRDRVDPYFRDMVDKEKSDKLVAGLLVAYKSIDSAAPVAPASAAK